MSCTNNNEIEAWAAGWRFEESSRRMQKTSLGEQEGDEDNTTDIKNGLAALLSNQTESAGTSSYSQIHQLGG